MATVGSYEAKTHLAHLLDRVEKGERITITRHGVAVAVLIPIGPGRRKPVEQVIEELLAFRAGNRLDGRTIREMIDEGRD